MRGYLLLALLVNAALGLPAQAQDRGAPVSNARELDAHLMRCFKPPAASAGSEITLAFSLDADGKLKGAPRIAYSKLTGDMDTKKAFVAAALKMLQNCTPVPVTKEFGLAAANKVRIWRLITRPKQREQSV
jgi:hypothetical protein